MAEGDLKRLSGRPVWIEWVDSNSVYGWRRPDEVEVSQMECVTLGFLVGETDEAVQVTATVSETGSADAILTIPRCAITKMQEIEFCSASR